MMKRLLIILDGASEPMVGNEHTTLADADLSNIDRIARRSLCGVVRTAPQEVQPDSLVCLLTILGISAPSFGVVGRAALEAAAHDIALTSGSPVVRCNLVRVANGRLADFTGSVPSRTAEQIATALAETFPMLRVGQAYRHFLLPEDTFEILSCIHYSEPHEHTGELIRDLLPWSESSEAQGAVGRLRGFMEMSARLCKGFGYHGLMLWPWGLSRMPHLPTFASLYGMNGACVCGIDLVDGIARALSLEVVRPVGATGDWNTDLAAKAVSTLQLLSRYDFVFVHINGADEAAHIRDSRLKRDFMEHIDRTFIGPVTSSLEAGRETYRILLCPDHHTSPQDGRHKAGVVPFLLCDSNSERPGVQHFDERSAARTGYQAETPLLPLLLDGGCLQRSV
jgi:2,3-bisphosphoglycerate-independent phosphoglycerate mutase